MDFVIIIVVCVKMCRIEKIIVEWRLGGGRKEKKASGPGAVSPCHHTTTTIFPPFGLVWLVSFSPLFSSLLLSPPRGHTTAAGSSSSFSMREREREGII